MVLNKHDIEQALRNEHEEIKSGRLKEDNPLDSSEGFVTLCQACRRGDLKVCQEKIQEGVNLNARDRFDYTPLILASLCGHYEVVQLLLESGALCERDTFQGERCLYNALNDRIRNLLLQYDYSKSTDPLQPLAGHITSLLNREYPRTTDLTLTTDTGDMNLHKFILAARSPYFAKKFTPAPEISTWKLPNTVPAESVRAVIRFLYFGEVSTEFGDGEEEAEILRGIERLSRTLEVERLFENIIDAGDKRLNRQRRTDEVARGRDQLESWFRSSVLQHKVHVDTAKAADVKWDRNNAIFADVLLQADVPGEEIEEALTGHSSNQLQINGDVSGGIPIGPFANASPAATRSPSRTRESYRDQHRGSKSVLFPCHRAMLLRSDYFMAMFSSGFKESQDTDYLQIIQIDCSPQVLEIILSYLYTENADFGLDAAIDVLFAADLLFIDKLKVKAATAISTLGNGGASIVEASNPRGETDGEEEEVLDIYDVVRAGWDTRVHRLEEFGARYIAYRLERYIDKEEFAELIQESANRIKERQETDTVELIDDIRFYLSERYRLRMEDAGLDEMMDEEIANAELESAQESIISNGSNGIHIDEIETKLQDLELTNGIEDTKSNILPDPPLSQNQLLSGGVIRTLDGDVAGDEFAQDAMNYTLLLGKLDALLERLGFDV